MPVMRKIPILFCLVLIAFGPLLGQPGQPLTVYPGDANNTRLCNHVDLLYIGLNYGDTGPVRNFLPDITWAPDSAQAWNGPAFLDQGYSDCDGDGRIDVADRAAIVQNFGLVHGGSFLPDTTSIGNANAPHLQINLVPDSLTVIGTVALNLAVNLGSSNIPVDSIYGFAFTIDFDPLIVDQISFAFSPSSFAIDSASSLQFVRIDTLLGKIYVSATNIDHQNRSGAGQIGTIGIVMDDDIRIAGMWNLLFTPSYFLGLSASGGFVNAYPQGDSMVITARPNPELGGLEIYPNPATDRLQVRSTVHELSSLRIYDAQGRLLIEDAHPNPTIAIVNTDQLPAGCYFLEIRAEERVLRRKLVIQSH